MGHTEAQRSSLAAFKRFGAYLKSRRQSRNISIGAAAALSERLRFDVAGRFSRPYLSQIERGKPVKLALPKALTLAAIYATTIESLMAQAPRELRERLAADLLVWRREGRPEPARLRSMPSVTAEIDMQVDRALAGISAGSMVPVGREEVAWQTIRKVILMSAAPAFLRCPQHAQLVKEHWRTISESVGGPASPVSPGFDWYGHSEGLLNWLLYEKRLWAELLDLVRAWTMVAVDSPANLANALVRMQFKDFGIDADYGVAEALPAAVVYGARWREVACLSSLADGVKLSHSGIARPPNPPDAAVDYIAFVVLGCRYDPRFTADARMCSFDASALAVGEMQPMTHPNADAGRFRNVAAFLARADHVTRDWAKRV